jgi:hypothetical protein
MTIPKIIAARAIDHRTLMIHFSNQEIKQYDISPLLEKAPFHPLKNFALFKALQIEPGGHALVWNEEIDLSEYELWKNGTKMVAWIEPEEPAPATIDRPVKPQIVGMP